MTAVHCAAGSALQCLESSSGSRSARVSALLFIACGLIATAARADAPPASSVASDLEEVVVTARRKEESLQSVPVAVSAISGAALRQQQVLRVEDLQRTVPSLSVTPTPRGDASPAYAIRGQRGPLQANSLTDAATGVYFAEVNQSRSVGTNQSLFDIKSVQVLKGPQGTLFGRNTTGGAVLITPNAPSDVFEGYGQYGVGDYGYRDLEGIINLPLTDTLAVRAGAKATYREGYLTNVINGQDADDLDAKSYRLSIDWKPTESLESTVIGTYYRNSGVGTALKLFLFDPRGVPAVPARPALVAALQSELAATQALGDYEYRNLNRLSSYDKTSSVQNTTTLHLGEVAFLGDVTLKNVIGYKAAANEYTADFCGCGLDVFELIGSVDNHDFSEEFQLQGKNQNLDYVAGLFYYHETGLDAFTSRTFGVLSSPSFTAAAGPLAPVLRANFPSYASNTDYDTKNTSYAVFAHGNYDLATLIHGLSLSAGVRATRDVRDVVWHNLATAGVSPNTWTCVANGVRFASPDRTLCAVGASTSFTEATYDVSVNYQLTPNELLYVVHRRGYRAGGFNPSPLVGVNPAFDPEVLKDVELGSKSDFDLAGVPVRLNVAAFYDWYDNIQRTIGVSFNGPSPATQVVNAAKAHLYGGEAELVLKPLRALQLTGSFSLVKAMYDEWVDHYLVAGILTPVDISDSQFAFIPEKQWSVSASYALPTPAEYGEVRLGISYYGQSGFSTIEISTHNCGPDGNYKGCLNDQGKLPGFSLTNARVDWRNVVGKGFDLALFVNNVTDEFYRSYSSTTLNLLGLASAAIGAPRMWGVELRVPFGGSAY